MSKEISVMFDDIFFIPVLKKVTVKKYRTYKVTYSCGSTWEFNINDLEIPDFSKGEQSGVTYCFDSLREALGGLKALGFCVTYIGTK